MRFLKGFFLCVIMFCLSNLCIARTEEDDVEKFSIKVADSIISIMKDNFSTENAKAQRLSDILEKDFDLDWMAKFALGRQYRDLSEKQKTEYHAEYKHYLVNNYLPILMKYSNETYQVFKIVPNNKDYIVDLRVFKASGERLVDLSYLVRQPTSKIYKVSDMIVEGVSTIFTQRSSFDVVIQSKGVDGFLKSLKSLKSENK